MGPLEAAAREDDLARPHTVVWDAHEHRRRGKGPAQQHACQLVNLFLCARPDGRPKCKPRPVRALVCAGPPGANRTRRRGSHSWCTSREPSTKPKRSWRCCWPRETSPGPRPARAPLACRARPPPTARHTRLPALPQRRGAARQRWRRCSPAWSLPRARTSARNDHVRALPNPAPAVLCPCGAVHEYIPPPASPSRHGVLSFARASPTPVRYGLHPHAFLVIPPVYTVSALALALASACCVLRAACSAGTVRAWLSTWRPSRVRSLLRTCAPRGVRVVALTKSWK